MSESSESHQEKVAMPEMEQQQDLDEVFSTFFQKVEELKPVAKPRSAKEYLQSNRDKIIHALSKGYTYEDLAKILLDCGFSISASTLRRYIGAVKGKKGDALTSNLDCSTAQEKSELSDVSNPAPTTTEPYQSQLRPRRRK
jgi:hypothetical protein